MNSKAFYKMTYGLFLLSTKSGEKDYACVINTAIQVGNDPTRISIAVINKNHTCDQIKESGVFNVSALTKKAPFALFQRFGMQSGRDVDKFADFSDVARSENGLYYLTQYANMYLSAKVVDSLDLGSHTLFIGEVTAAEVLSEEESCTYGYYQSDIKPKPAAPKSEKKRYVCNICGYIYEGDELPADYLCPICHHGVADFSLLEPEKPSKKWVCTICGYVYEGPEPPAVCPLCNVGPEKFEAT